MTLTDEITNYVMKLKMKFVDEHFIHYYCNTCHSRQCSTIEKPMTTHEWNFSLRKSVVALNGNN